MTWHGPTTVEEIRSSMHRSFVWRAQRFDLAADRVAVCSIYSERGNLGRAAAAGHALSDHVLTGSEAYHQHYMTTRGPESRTPHPSTVMYYVRDLRSGKAVLALQADGTILDELATIRPDLRATTIEALRDGMNVAADNQRTRVEHYGWD
jgi:hypothetical protein